MVRTRVAPEGISCHAQSSWAEQPSCCIRGDLVAEPTGLLRLFGKELRRARETAGLTQEELGEKVAYSRGQIGMVENGQRRMRADTVRDLDEILTTGGLLIRIWEDAGAERTAMRIADLLRAEAEATLIRSYHPTLVPGLLQTEGYIRGLFSAGLLAGQDEHDVDLEVQRRIERQQILLNENPPRYTVVLYEAVLWGVVQDNDTMHEQLEHLLAMSRRRRIHVQVIPFAYAKYAAVAPLTIIDMDGETVVHLEPPISSGSTAMEPHTIAEAREQFDLLRSQAAPTDQSLDLIAARMRELRQ